MTSDRIAGTSADYPSQLVPTLRCAKHACVRRFASCAPARRGRPVPTGPGRIDTTGLRDRSRSLVRRIRVPPNECRSPLTKSGTRPPIPDAAASSRSCCARQPLCQYGFATSVVSRFYARGSRMSEYHSPQLPALHPSGVEGTLTTCATSGDAYSRRSWFSLNGKAGFRIRSEENVLRYPAPQRHRPGSCNRLAQRSRP